MKKRVIILCIFILSICLVSAVHEISPSSFSVDVGASTLYNITVNNTDTGQNANITQVSITMPSSFTFVEGSNGTDSLSVFTNTSTILSWTNSTEYLINGSEWKNFWFNANATTSGNYIITVVTLNSTGSSSSNINVEIITPICTQDWSCTSWSICINETQKRNCTDLNDCMNETDKPITNKSCGCVPEWHCTNWSECINAIQIRSCVDFNTCGDNSTKPTENESCDCIPDWYCTEWQPKKCPENETQTRTCNDLNDCGTDEGKSDETKSCIPDSRANFLFIFIVIIIIIIIITVIILIIGLQKRTKPQISDINPQPLGMPSKPL